MTVPISLLFFSLALHTAAEPGLLFYLSGDRGLTADYSAASTPEPTFVNDVRIVPDGAKGAGVQCGHTQLLAYRAPGNIYAARGTLAFFWRSREPAGPTPFPVFRVGYADHSSWDMVWLRVDYNGQSGFDAFVTDASLARTRVSHRMEKFPAPDRWTHLALAWDETQGIRFYVDGREVGRRDGAARFDAALDQFGPHSRTISPMQVQSAYNFVRGGDIDELRIYDRMLTGDNVARLARAEPAGELPPIAAAADSVSRREAWAFRYGWNRAGEYPPALAARHARIRKVEIHDVYDVKRWWWKGTDGIRETTWPAVFNRSRLPGRNDYFQLPDWDCYSISGKSVTFTLPDESWNQIEISGAASGRVIDAGGRTILKRPAGQERTVHRLDAPVRAGKLTFENAEQETPIGELGAYLVAEGPEPTGIARLAYTLTGEVSAAYPSLKPLTVFIAGRHEADERATMVALPAGAPRARSEPARAGRPIVHILVPADFRDFDIDRRRFDFSYGWMNMDAGLDGVALDLPALRVAPTHGGTIPLNVQVKDPTWPLRNLLDVSFSVKPGEPHTIFLDTRDRILPNGKSLYLTIASPAPDFGPAALEGAALRLVFKTRAEALPEHALDRFTQARDNFANIIEERPNNRRLDLYNRLEADLTDLLRVDPDHELGRQYWHEYNREQPRPAVKLGVPPAGVPAWAFRQVEHLAAVKRIINWYIDKRQIDNGELGGGLSDDGDLTNAWPAAAFMGIDPEKVTGSVLRLMEAYYDQGLFTNGLPTIQTDELHSYEEGIQVLGQSLLLDYGSPKQLERAMETARSIEALTGINKAGHRHIRSSYFSGTTVSEESVWGWSKPSSFLILQPAIALVEFNGAPHVRRWLVELADGLLAHRKPDAGGRPAIRATVQFSTDSDLPVPSERAWPLMWAAYRWTGDRKYLQPFLDAGPRSLTQISSNALDLMDARTTWGSTLATALSARRDDPLRHFVWQLSGDTHLLEELYAEQAAAAGIREYINTEGSLWIDRVTVSDADLQRARLGGVALSRNAIYPGHAVSWTFAGANAEEKVAILVPEATPRRLRVIAHNLDSRTIRARMTTWAIEPGTWRLTEKSGNRSVALQRGSETEVVFPPGASTIEMELTREAVPYWSRPDWGLSPADVKHENRVLTVTLHSLGAVDAPPARLMLRDRSGRLVATAPVPALPAPLDVQPKTTIVKLMIPAASDVRGGTLSVESEGPVPEITLRNNTVRM